MSAEALTARYSVDPSHPALSGHFPGNPIVPAVMLLRFAAQMLEYMGMRCTEFERMKFLRPVRPGELIDVSIAPPGGNHGTVELAVAGETVARGVWRSSPG